jgi:RNA polymerase sigma-B factor
LTIVPRDDGAGAETARTIPKPAPSARRDLVRGLLREYRASHDPAVRDRLVDLNSDLVHFIARRFANRGEPLEDIEQVGFLGLIHAIERFDPELGNEFSTFATPTIMGEIRRYFRDRSWAVRVPRRLQENLLRVNAAAQQLTGELGRSPSISEIGERIGLEPEDVLAALEVSPAQHTVSLEAAPAGRGDEALTLGDRALLEQAMAHLNPREREIMALRFVEELPQTEVAKRLGISQMHVSRLQRAAVEHLRREMGENVLV